MISFGKNIKRMIELYEGKLLIIYRLPEVCTCYNKGIKEPNPQCPNCYGTGHQTKIRQIKGVVQESNGMTTVRGAGSFSIIKEIFIKAEYPIFKDDLIIFENQVFQAFQIKNFRLEKNEIVYKICYATPVKYDSNIILKHLERIGLLCS